jgi:type II secretory ATPase GspE/PulE/Tfp pilus assembly ATPase PilB-like protein
MKVNARIGPTCATGLRTILGQDPDVSMVGECRDVETAHMAIQAALTGHVVFSTIHANSAVGVISRLLDMEIDPFLVATALSLSMAQRLVRVICSGCKTTIEGRELLMILRANGISEEKMQALGIEIDPRAPYLHATGCPRCRHTGYAGRQAVFEMFEMTEEIRELVVADHFNADAVRRVVRQSRMTSMVENSRDLVA